MYLFYSIRSHCTTKSDAVDWPDLQHSLVNMHIVLVMVMVMVMGMVTRSVPKAVR